MSLPASNPVRPAHSAAAPPPDEPPGERVRSHGLPVLPYTGVEALPVREHRRHVGLAEHVGAGAEQPFHHHGVRGRDGVALLRQPPGGRQAGDAEALLHRHRHAVQRPGRGGSAVELLGARAGAVEVAHHHGVDRRVVPPDPFDVVVEQFQAADRAPLDQRRLAPCGQEGGVGGHRGQPIVALNRPPSSSRFWPDDEARDWPRTGTRRRRRTRPGRRRGRSATSSRARRSPRRRCGRSSRPRPRWCRAAGRSGTGRAGGC